MGAAEGGEDCLGAIAPPSRGNLECGVGSKMVWRRGWVCSPCYLLPLLHFLFFSLFCHLCPLLHPSPGPIGFGCPSFAVGPEKWMKWMRRALTSTCRVWRSFKLRTVSIAISKFVVAHFTGLLKS